MQTLGENSYILQLLAVYIYVVPPYTVYTGTNKNILVPIRLCRRRELVSMYGFKLLFLSAGVGSLVVKAVPMTGSFRL